MLSRNTYLEVNLKKLESNVSKIVNYYNGYKYHFGVVKADSYGLNGIDTVKSIIKGGCNYLAVATLDEALIIRKEIKDIPILCLGVIPIEYIKEAINNNITLTINSLEYLLEIVKLNLKNITVHIKLNTGMNRLGINNSIELNKIIEVIQKCEINLEGLYTHIYNASVKEDYMHQVTKFKEITKNITLDDIEVVHISASEALVNYEKLDFVNGCRLGIIMYGFTENNLLELESIISLKSEVIQINELKIGETVGYNGAYKANKDIKVAVVAIGYADGIIRKNTGRYVYINNKPYKIVGNICMDMLFVLVDDSVKVHDEVLILKDNKHILEVAKYLDTIPYEVLCNVNKRVSRVYIN